MNVEQVLTILQETPDRLAEFTHGATPAQLRTAPARGEWSAAEVLAHLRSCADMWGQAIQVIVADDRPTLKAINPTTWIESTNYPQLEFRPSLNVFRSQRAQLLALLQSLPPGGWSRSATVVGAGKPLERSVYDYAERLARHEHVHWKQLQKTVNEIMG
ncbi:MAG: DinB family protein [Candidatus Dormiibacterota bacterium]